MSAVIRSRTLGKVMAEASHPKTMYARKAMARVTIVDARK